MRPVTKTDLRAIRKQATLHIEAEAEQHGLEVEDRIYEKLDRILEAKSPDEAYALAARAKDSHNIHCLTKGRRPKDISWYERNARKARSLAKSKELKKESDEADRHLRRAERYEAEVRRLRKEAAAN